MKKILIVTDAWAPLVNGVTHVQDALIPALQSRGYEVRVIEPGQFFTLPTPTYPDIRLALFAYPRVVRVIREEKPDAIHLMTEGPLGWAARAVCLKDHIPFTTWYHTQLHMYVDIRLRGLLRPVNALLRRFHAAAEHCIVSTETLKGQLLENRFKDNIVVVPLGVDTDIFVRNPSPPLPPMPKPVFVYFGRVAPEKSPEEFLKLDLPGTKVVMGDGPLLPGLKKKYPEVIFSGRYVTGGKEFINQLSQCDVFVFPSRTETFGLVVLEALACGIPVAAHDVMGPRDIITHGKDGYLSDDIREAALACLQLSPADCRAKAERYNWERSIVDAFITHLSFIE